MAGRLNVPYDTEDTIAYVNDLKSRLQTAVNYAGTFRSDTDPECVEACEKSIRYANMLSQAILALKN